MRRLLLALACAAALYAPASMAQGVPVAKRCTGSVKVHSVLATSIRTAEGLVHGRQGAHPQPAEPGGVEPVVPSRGRSAAADHGLRRLGLSLLPQAQPRLLRDHGRQARAVAREPRAVGRAAALSQASPIGRPRRAGELRRAYCRIEGEEGRGGPGACSRPPGRAVLLGGAPATAGQDPAPPDQRRPARSPVRTSRAFDNTLRRAARSNVGLPTSGGGRTDVRRRRLQRCCETRSLCAPPHTRRRARAHRRPRGQDPGATAKRASRRCISGSPTRSVKPRRRARRVGGLPCAAAAPAPPATAAVAASSAVSGQRTSRKPSSRRRASSSSGVRPPSTALNSSGVSGNAAATASISCSLSGASTNRTSAPASR